MPVEFLSDVEAAAFGRFDGALLREDLDRVFFLDDTDRQLIDKRRGAHNRLGFALQLTTVRWLGNFLADPTDVPGGVLEYLAGQLGEDASCVGRYLERRRTRFEHVDAIKVARGLGDFVAVSDELDRWVWARAWMTGDGPRAIFSDAVLWLREHDVLLPGVTTLARIVARGRAESDQRLWDLLAGVPSAPQRRMLQSQLEIPQGARVSDLERWRKGPADRSGRSLQLALQRVAEIHAVGVDAAAVRALVPARRLVDLARYGLAAKAPRLARHPPARRLATLLATVVHLQASSIDDCLELFDLLMVTELLGNAARETAKQRAGHHPKLARASVKLAMAVEKLLDASASGEMLRLEVYGSRSRRSFPAAPVVKAGRPAVDLARIAPIWRSMFPNGALGGVVRPSAGAPRPIGQAISATLAGGGWPIKPSALGPIASPQLVRMHVRYTGRKFGRLGEPQRCASRRDHPRPRPRVRRAH